MPYRFEPGRIYRMPTHFGPAPGPRQMSAEAKADPTKSPRKTLISASFLTEGSALERHIPERFTLAGDPVVTIEFHYMTHIDWLAGRGYTMIHVWWPVVFKGDRDRVIGRFLAVMWENLADPIITGRGEIGQPKLFAEIPELRIVGGTYHCEASWMGFRFLDLQATELLEPVSETSARAQMESFGSRPWQRAHYLYSPMRRSLIPDGEPIRRPTSLAGHFDPVPTGIQS